MEQQKITAEDFEHIRKLFGPGSVLVMATLKEVNRMYAGEEYMMFVEEFGEVVAMKVKFTSLPQFVQQLWVQELVMALDETNMKDPKKRVQVRPIRLEYVKGIQDRLLDARLMFPLEYGG